MCLADISITVQESCYGTHRKEISQLSLDSELLKEIVEYPLNEGISNCSWVIIAPGNRTLNLTILEFKYKTEIRRDF